METPRNLPPLTLQERIRAIVSVVSFIALGFGAITLYNSGAIPFERITGVSCGSPTVMKLVREMTNKIAAARDISLEEFIIKDIVALQHDPATGNYICRGTVVFGQREAPMFWRVMLTADGGVIVSENFTRWELMQLEGM